MRTLDSVGLDQALQRLECPAGETCPAGGAPGDPARSARLRVSALLLQSVAVLAEGLKHPNPKTRMEAAKAILDRGGLAPRQSATTEPSPLDVEGARRRLIAAGILVP